MLSLMLAAAASALIPNSTTIYVDTRDLCALGKPQQLERDRRFREARRIARERKAAGGSVEIVEIGAAENGGTVKLQPGARRVPVVRSCI